MKPELGALTVATSVSSADGLPSDVSQLSRIERSLSVLAGALSIGAASRDVFSDNGFAALVPTALRAKPHFRCTIISFSSMAAALRGGRSR